MNLYSCPYSYLLFLPPFPSRSLRFPCPYSAVLTLLPSIDRDIALFLALASPLI